MKKQLLSVLPVLCAAMSIHAQDVTSYRGAFAPAPVRQWTESWTNFDPQNTPYGTPNVTVSADIITNTTWTSNNVYLLSTVIYVNSGVTLTIQPGTVIRGASGNASLIVVRGGKLIAEGTVCNPVVFTSNAAAGSRAAGQWGGVILLGNAKHNLGTNNLIEGLSNADPRNFHGGTDDNDNSGVVQYVRIEYSGFIFSANNEINALTMGSVGRGTTIDYVQVTRGDDDAFEWFGGSVNAKHLVAYQCKDDDFDSDNGFSGTVQYALGIKDPNFSDASQSEGFESDNSATGIDGQLPKTSAKFYNVTQIGGFRCASNTAASGVAPTALFLHRRGVRVRRNSDLKIVNSILMNNWRGLFADNAVVGANPTAPVTVNYNEDSAVFRNNIVAGDFTTTWTGTTYNGTKSLAWEDVNSRNIGTLAAYQNDSLNSCSVLADAWNVNPSLADFRPNVAGDGAIVTDPASLNNGADLVPIIEIGTSIFGKTGNGQSPEAISEDFVVNILETGSGATNGLIAVAIPKPSGWDVTVPGIILTGVPVSGISGISDIGGVPTPNYNSNWNFRDDGANIVATSKPGVIIAKSDFTTIGFVVTLKASTPTGTNQNLGVAVTGGGTITASSTITILTH